MGRFLGGCWDMFGMFLEVCWDMYLEVLAAVCGVCLEGFGRQQILEANQH